MIPLYALAISAIIVGVVTGISLIGSRNIERTLVVGACLALVLFGINWLVIYHLRPVIGLNSISFFQNWWMWAAEWLVAIVVICLAAYDWDAYEGLSKSSIGLIVVLVLTLIISPCFSGIWSEGRAKDLANHVHVKFEKVGNYPDTDASHIVIVPEQVARKDASVAMSSGGGNLSTQYQVLEPNLQSVQGHAYWIVALRPSGYRTSNQVNGVVPGYIVVDAENPSVSAVIKTTDANGKKLSITYSKDGNFSHNLQRHVWTNGYAGSKVEDWTMEVDDQWRPYWTASVNKQTMGLKRTVPKALLTVNAQSGKITEYGLNKMPAWIDRIYSADTAKQLMNWWGNYGRNPYHFLNIGRTKTNRLKVHGNPTLVYTKEGYPVWQMELTSINSDSSVAYMALFDGRTDTARLYQIPDVPIESTVVNAIENSNANIHKLTPTHLSMHKIYGKLTWVASLVPKGDGSSSSSAINQGFALLPADAQPNSGDVVIATTLSQGLNAYQEVLASSGSAKPGEDSSLVVTHGIIDRASSGVATGNNTLYYFSIVGDKHLYAVVFNPASTNPEFGSTLIHTGDKVSFSYADTGSTLRQVQLFQDLSLQVAQ